MSRRQLSPTPACRRRGQWLMELVQELARLQSLPAWASHCNNKNGMLFLANPTSRCSNGGADIWENSGLLARMFFKLLRRRARCGIPCKTVLCHKSSPPPPRPCRMRKTGVCFNACMTARRLQLQSVAPPSVCSQSGRITVMILMMMMMMVMSDIQKHRFSPAIKPLVRCNIHFVKATDNFHAVTLWHPLRSVR